MNRSERIRIATALTLLVAAPIANAMSVHELSDRAAAVIRASALEAHPGADVSVEMFPLDSRLTFPDCANLEIKVQGTPLGRASALARCTGPHPWSATLPARIAVSKPVVVARRPVPRGATITAADVELSPQDIGDLRGQYLTALDDAVGAEAKRDLHVDTAVAPRHLKVPMAVRRGDQVSIVSQQGMVVVYATGTALANGKPGDQIGVRNSQSERVIRAWVIGRGRVRSGSPPTISPDV